LRVPPLGTALSLGVPSEFAAILAARRLLDQAKEKFDRYLLGSLVENAVDERDIVSFRDPFSIDLFALMFPPGHILVESTRYYIYCYENVRIFNSDLSIFYFL